MNILPFLRTALAISFVALFLACPLILTAWIVMLFALGFMYAEAEHYLRELHSHKAEEFFIRQELKLTKEEAERFRDLWRKESKPELTTVSTASEPGELDRYK